MAARPPARALAVALVLAAGACGGPEAPAPPGPGEVRVIVTLAAAADLSAAAGAPIPLRRVLVVAALRRAAALAEPLVRRWILDHGGRALVSLPAAHALAATLPRLELDPLRRLPGVARVDLDATLLAPPVAGGGGGPAGWNLAAVRAPALWSRGWRGAGVVVANLDTGVDGRHPDLAGRWRGGKGGWFDPFGGSSAPYDAIGHGTQTMGILAGGSASGGPIGVAPEATWIAAKIYDDQGTTTLSVLHQAFGWILDPDGDPSTADAPDVVSVSWGEGTAGACDPAFQPDLDALRAAGIMVVIAAGNSGPAASSSVSPANGAGTVSVGAVDASDVVAPFSSRGPSACTGGVFPDVVAPGVDVTTADVSLAGLGQWTVVSGTSYAAPHVAGLAALLWGALAHPTVSAVETALRSTAVDLGPAGPDDAYGNGLVDGAAALSSFPAAALSTSGGTP